MARTTWPTEPPRLEGGASLADIDNAILALKSGAPADLNDFNEVAAAIADDASFAATMTSALAGKAASAHEHSAADITSGTLALGRGGTGQTTAAPAFDALAPTTTRGDLIARGASSNARLAIGTSGYHLSSDGTDPAWAGFLQSGTSAVTRTWQAKGRDHVSVKDFGAVGNGVTDDYDAIVAAIASGAGTIYFPAGNYVTSAVIVLTTAVRLVGAGQGTTTISASHTSGAVIKINSPRCAVVDLSISSLAGSARRTASPFGRTAPDAAVTGTSNNRGIFLEETTGVLLTHTHLDRLLINAQPGDGVNMSGAGAGCRFDALNISFCGGHGIYCDDGDRDGTAKTRCGIVDISDCIIQECWGHGIALATEATSTVFRFNLLNNDIYNNCKGDGGVNQPSFYVSVKSEYAIRAQNTKIELGAAGLSDVGVTIGTSIGVEINNFRFVECTTYGVLVNGNCSRITINNPFMVAAPTVGFRVQSGCDNVTIHGVKSSEFASAGAIIDAESEVELLLDSKKVLTVPGSGSLFYANELKAATVASGILSVQSGLVDVAGQGGVADDIDQLRFTTSIEVPDGYRFTLMNRNAYALTVRDRTVVGGAANIELGGANIVLDPSATMGLISYGGIYYSETSLPTVAIADGGTGATTARAAAANLGAGYTLAHSSVAAAAVTGTTAETTVATITVPANAMGPNGYVVVEGVFTNTGAAGNKTLRSRWNGLAGTLKLFEVTATTTQSYNFRGVVHNVNSASSQKGHATGVMYGATATAPATASIATTSAVDIVITTQLANSADSSTLESYSATLFYGA